MKIFNVIIAISLTAVTSSEVSAQTENAQQSDDPAFPVPALQACSRARPSR